MDPEVLRDLARRMAKGRTMITVSHSLQRAEHGEQPVWMGVVLGAMLGQLGLPGGGFVYALGAMGNLGKPPLAAPLPTLPQARNPIAAYIPVARVADMLLRPGEPYQFDGQTLTYPDIRLVYWAGGNPFHHHQDLFRLEKAFARPDAVIVHEQTWTGTALHADIVLPATVTLERNDIGAAAHDPLMVAMHQAAPPTAQARDDYAIFRGLADRFGVEAAFGEGRSAEEWLEHLYQRTLDHLKSVNAPAPDFQAFWALGELELPTSTAPDRLREFRRDPQPVPSHPPTA